MTTLFHKILAKIKKWKNWQGKVIITEKGKNNSLVGKNSSYKQVVFPRKVVEKNNLKIGDKVLAHTKSLGKHEILADL